MAYEASHQGYLQGPNAMHCLRAGCAVNPRAMMGQGSYLMTGAPWTMMDCKRLSEALRAM
jgi:hypothetical protein